jgi:hypothetical protein
MARRQRRESDPKQTDDDKLDDALKDSFPASDPVSFIEPAPKEPNDTALGKDAKPTRRR